MIGVDHRDFQAVHQPDGVNSDLFVIETVIDLFQRWPLENSLGIFERDAVTVEVGFVLVFVPSLAHGLYLHNVNI